MDLVNTVDWRTSDCPAELLNSYPDLVRWGQHTGVLTEREARHLLREAARRPAEAEAVLDSAVTLRETIFRIFSGVAAGRQPHRSDVEFLNGKLTEAFSHLRVAPESSGFGWEWKDGEDRLDRMLWAIVRAAGELLVDRETLAQLRECANQECGWLFVDTSRNKSRRWCSMEVCGNRAKARRHYRQAKSGR